MAKNEIEINVKVGIHSQDWDKTITEIKNSIPTQYHNTVINILEKNATRYF